MLCRSGGRSKGPLQRPPGFQHENPPFFSEFAKIDVFWAKDSGNDFNIRPRRKINVRFAKDSRKYIVCLRRMAVCIGRNLDQTATKNL